MDKTFPQRLHKYELVLRGFFLKALRLQIKPYKDFYISNGYLGSPSILVSPTPFSEAYINSFRYIADAETYGEWKRQDFEYKNSKKEFTMEDGFLVISETLRSIFIQAGISYYNNIQEDLNQTTIERIENFVRSARISGSTDAEIYKALENVIEQQLRERSGVIAATEAHTIMSLVKRTTAMQFFNQKGITGYHTWFTRLDERVRHTHTEVEGRTLPIDVKYVLNRKRGGQEFALYPGDTNLSAENRVYCRCMEDLHSDPNKYKKKGE